MKHKKSTSHRFGNDIMPFIHYVRSYFLDERQESSDSICGPFRYDGVFQHDSEHGISVDVDSYARGYEFWMPGRGNDDMNGLIWGLNYVGNRQTHFLATMADEERAYALLTFPEGPNSEIWVSQVTGRNRTQITAHGEELFVHLQFFLEFFYYKHITPFKVFDPSRSGAAHIGTIIAPDLEGGSPRDMRR